MIQDRVMAGEQEAESSLRVACLGTGSVLESAQPGLVSHLEGRAGTGLGLDLHLDTLSGWHLRLHHLKVTLCWFRVHCWVVQLGRLQQGQVVGRCLQVRLGKVEGNVLRPPCTRRGQEAWRAVPAPDQ